MMSNVHLNSTVSEQWLWADHTDIQIFKSMCKVGYCIVGNISSWLQKVNYVTGYYLFKIPLIANIAKNFKLSQIKPRLFTSDKAIFLSAKISYYIVYSMQLTGFHSKYTYKALTLS